MSFEPTLPPFLQNTEPLEPEHLPLQMALLTMEVAEMRTRMVLVSQALNNLGRALLLDFPLAADELQEMARAILPAQMQEVNDASENASRSGDG